MGSTWVLKNSKSTDRASEGSCAAGCEERIIIDAARAENKPTPIAKYFFILSSKVRLTSDYQMNFSANWISLDVVVVEVNKPAIPFAAPVESKMSVLPGVSGVAKFARFKILKTSALNCTLKVSEILRT